MSHMWWRMQQPLPAADALHIQAHRERVDGELEVGVVGQQGRGGGVAGVPAGDLNGMGIVAVIIVRALRTEHCGLVPD
jgi:hypothetical protein